MADGEDKVERTWIFADGSPSFDFDAVVRESHESKITITENPIEGGSPTHDHIIILPKRYEMEGVISDNPMPSGGATVFGSIGGRRSVTGFEMMVNLQESGVPFTVLSGLKRYASMLLESIIVDQDASTAEVCAFRAQLMQVRIVNTQIVDVPPRRPGKTKRQAPKKTDGGEKKAEVPSEDQRKSLLLKLGQYVSSDKFSLDSVLP
jgi:hypothetical protein